MSSLVEIERAVDALPVEEKQMLLKYLEQKLRPRQSRGHSVLDVPTGSVGQILRPLEADDDLLDEMLNDES